jgi:transmembrane sensor
MAEREKPGQVVQLGGPDRIAADWVARLDANPSEENRQAFERWKAESETNRQAADRLSGLWSELDALAELRSIVEPGVTARPARRTPGADRRRRVWAAAAAAAAMIAVATPFIWTTFGPGRAETYVTPIGKQRTINLADGSTVQLNTNSELEVRLRRHARDLVLTRGEAFFEVAPDHSRPFTVHTREGSVRAVGTAFAVRLDPGALRVTLTRGTVRLERPGAVSQSGGDVLTAQAGAHPEATITPQAVRRETVSSQQIARELSWRQGVLVFDGQTLPKVIEDVGRYTDVQIEIADPSLRALKVGGYFDAGDVSAMLEALQSGFGVHVEWLDAKHVRLSSAKG